MTSTTTPLTLAAFQLEESIGQGRWAEVYRLLGKPVADDDVTALIALLEQTAAVMRIHEDDFDEYLAVRANCDPELHARLVTLLGSGFDSPETT